MHAIKFYWKISTNCLYKFYVNELVQKRACIKNAPVALSVSQLYWLYPKFLTMCLNFFVDRADPFGTSLKVSYDEYGHMVNDFKKLGFECMCTLAPLGSKLSKLYVYRLLLPILLITLVQKIRSDSAQINTLPQRRSRVFDRSSANFAPLKTHLKVNLNSLQNALPSVNPDNKGDALALKQKEECGEDDSSEVYVFVDAKDMQPIFEPGVQMTLEPFALRTSNLKPDDIIPKRFYIRHSDKARVDRDGMIIEHIFLQRRLPVPLVNDPMSDLWLKADKFVEDLYKEITSKTPGKSSYPFLHRRVCSESESLKITDELHIIPQRTIPSAKFTTTIGEIWQEIITRYGELNKLQMEERAIIDRCYVLLAQYQEAVGSRDLATKFKFFLMLVSMEKALSYILVNEYMIREAVWNARSY